jgi:hypothetical protein
MPEPQPTLQSTPDTAPKEIDLSQSLPKIEGDEFTSVLVTKPGPEVYEVDLTTYTCNCPDWQKLRGQFPDHDARRACKHIAQLISEEPHAQHLTGLAHLWAMESIEGDEGIPPFTEMKAYEVAGVPVALMNSLNRGWVDVLAYPEYVRFERAYSLFGYDLTAQEWSYGQGPGEAGVIESLITSNFTMPTGENSPAAMDHNEELRSNEIVSVPDPRGNLSIRLVLAALVIVVLVALGLWLSK